MPDFTYITSQQCKKISQISIEINGYSVSRFNDFLFNHCTCKGFQFRKQCKHLEMADKLVCSWHKEYGITQTEKQEKDMVCPECEGETEYVRVAV